MQINEMAHTHCNSDDQCCADRPEDLDVCCEGGKGGMLLPMFGDAEQRWHKGLRGFLYLIGMLWCFLGVAIIADLFMGALPVIRAIRAWTGDPLRDSRPASATVAVSYPASSRDAQVPSRRSPRRST